MSAGKMNIEIVKGKTLRRRFQLLDGTPTGLVVTQESIALDVLNGVLTPRNLAGSVFTAKALIGSVTITFATTIVDEANGWVEFVYSKEQTASIAGTRGVWDCTQQFPLGGDAILVLEGNVNVTKAVS